MGIPVVTVGNEHVCPMKDGRSPHKGGKVIEGVSGVFIDGIPIATIGNKCQCCSPKMNTITSGVMGILVDGKPIAVLGSQTEHGGNVIEGNPGVTVSGGFATRSALSEDFEPQIFNLQWKREENIVRRGTIEDKVILSADTVGYADGEEVTIQIYEDGNNEAIDEVKGTVNNGRVEVEWKIKTDDDE